MGETNDYFFILCAFSQLLDFIYEDWKISSHVI